MAWNRPSNDGRAGSPCPPRRGGTPRPTVRGVIAGAVVVLGAGIAAWWLWPDASTPVREGSDGTVGKRIKEVKPALSVPVPVATNDSVVKTEETNAVEEIVLKPGTIYAIDPREKAKQKAVPRICKTGIETVLASLFSIEVGEAPPMALPKLSKSEMDRLAEILTSKETVTVSDTEETKCVKETLDFAKSEYRKYIKNGGAPEMFCEFCRQELQRAYVERRDAQNSILKFAKELGDGDRETLREYVDKVNGILSEKGIKPVNNGRINMLLGETEEKQ